MDLQHQLIQFRDWAFDLSQPTQRTMWAAAVIIAGYVAGLIVARILHFSAIRISGLAHRKTDADGGKSADTVMVDILASIIRAAILVGAIGVAASVLGLYDIHEAQTLAFAAVKGLAILVAVWFLGSWLGSRVRSFGKKVSRRSPAGNQTLFDFLAALVRFGSMAIGLIAALQQFGFPIASLVAVIGAAGLAIALALQDTLKAVAAGVIIAVFRPYRVGDYVKVAGEEGTVADITPFTTSLNTVDNREVIITNDKCWGSAITNFSSRSLRRLDLVFSIAYEDDVDHALGVLKAAAESDPRIRQEPPVWVKVTALSASSVDLRLRAWCSSHDHLDLRGDVLKIVKQAFDREGITIPYPHQVGILRQDAPASGVDSSLPNRS